MWDIFYPFRAGGMSLIGPNSMLNVGISLFISSSKTGSDARTLIREQLSCIRKKVIKTYKTVIKIKQKVINNYSN